MVGKTIFVVEDEPAVRTVIVETLRDDGYDVTGFGDGYAALAELDHRQPDLVLLDMRMPRMDGFQFLERLRVHPHGGGIPVVIVSGLGDELLQAIDAKAAERLGVAGIFAKPFDMPTLLRYVRGTITREPVRRAPPARST